MFCYQFITRLTNPVSVSFRPYRDRELTRFASKMKPNPVKSRLRIDIANRIAALTAEEKQRQSKTVYDKMINHPWYQSASRISLYMSTDDEVNMIPIIEHMKARGAAAFVPQYAGGVMRMLKLDDDDEKTMPKTKHGIQQHSKDQQRENAVETGGLDLIIAPGVAFSKAGARLGHGGGYYDKYITNLRATQKIAPKVIAVAFTCQILEDGDIPMNAQDQRVDDVISGE